MVLHLLHPPARMVTRRHSKKYTTYSHVKLVGVHHEAFYDNVQCGFNVQCGLRFISVGNQEVEKQAFKATS